MSIRRTTSLARGFFLFRMQSQNQQDEMEQRDIAMLRSNVLFDPTTPQLADLDYGDNPRVPATLCAWRASASNAQDATNTAGGHECLVSRGRQRNSPSGIYDLHALRVQRDGADHVAVEQQGRQTSRQPSTRLI